MRLLLGMHAEDLTAGPLPQGALVVVCFDPMRELSKILRAARESFYGERTDKRRGRWLTAREVADVMPGECREAVVSRWERGVETPNAARMEALIRLYGLDPALAWQAWAAAEVAKSGMRQTERQRRMARALIAAREEATTPDHPEAVRTGDGPPLPR